MLHLKSWAGLGNSDSAFQWRCVKKAQVQQAGEMGSERVLLTRMWMTEGFFLYWTRLRKHVGCSEEKRYLSEERRIQKCPLSKHTSLNV